MLGEDKRKHARRLVTLRAVLRAGDDADGPVVECKIRDLSVGGACVEAADAVASAPNLILDIDRFGRYSAELVWTRHPILGLSFRHSPELMHKLVAAVALHA
jgi:hypothetical protein